MSEAATTTKSYLMADHTESREQFDCCYTGITPAHIKVITGICVGMGMKIYEYPSGKGIRINRKINGRTFNRILNQAREILA